MSARYWTVQLRRRRSNGITHTISSEIEKLTELFRTADSEELDAQDKHTKF